MKVWIAALVLLLLSVAAPRVTTELYEIQLPAGTHGSIAIGWTPNGAERVLDPKTWLDQGYAGVRFVGAGVGQTTIRCTSWDGITIAVAQHKGLVQFEHLTIHAGFSKAVHFGLASRSPPIPEFKLRMVDCRGYVPPPTAQGRTKWWAFLYNADAELVDCVIDAKHASEHAWYQHQYAQYGVTWLRVIVTASGAECFKSRGDALETAWSGPSAKIRLISCSFSDWYQPHSDRGGAAVVLQGAAADLIVDSCVFYGGPTLGTIPASSRGKCIMVSSEGDSFDVQSGRVGIGTGNGHVVIRNSAMVGGPGQENYTTIVRVGRNGGTQLAARGVLIDGCGIYGERMSVQVKDVAAGKFALRRSNTPTIRSRCAAIGMDVAKEAGFPTSARVIPVSEGVAQ